MHAMLLLVASLLSSAALPDAVFDGPAGEILLRALLETEVDPDVDTGIHVRGEQQDALVELGEHRDVQARFDANRGRQLAEEPESLQQAFQDDAHARVISAEVGEVTHKAARFDQRLHRLGSRTERANHREEVVSLHGPARHRLRHGRHLSQIHTLNTTGISSDNRLGARTDAPVGLMRL